MLNVISIIQFENQNGTNTKDIIFSSFFLKHENLVNMDIHTYIYYDICYVAYYLNLNFKSHM